MDDGLATGITARAGLAALRKQGAARLVLAVPIAAPESVAEFQGLADEVITAEAAPHPLWHWRLLPGFPPDQRCRNA
ncbi:MAG: hypothetical protein ACKPB8_07150 [Alphaproteobacteria bacterium]